MERSRPEFPSSEKGMQGLSELQISQFERDGFLILPNVACGSECQLLKSAAAALMAAYDPLSAHSFSRNGSYEPRIDDLYLKSAADISFFLEEEAIDAATGTLKLPKELSVNKIGHALHDLHPLFRSFSRSPQVAAILRSLGYKRPLPVQSQYLYKQPKIGGPVVPHQDATFIRTSPSSCIGFWWALEHADVDNGCLWALPGSHKCGVHRQFFLRADGSVDFDAQEPDYDPAKFVPLACPAGSLILLHGQNVHSSAPNNSELSRHSYSLHFVESCAGHTWARDNWLQREADFSWQPLYEDLEHR